MAKVIDQTIPGELADAYDQTLHRESIWLPGSSIRVVRKRVPFKIPPMQNKSLATPSHQQRMVRQAFKNCTICFGKQKDSGGAVPPATGPRNRSWWYDESLGSGLFYYDYFIQQTWQGFFDGPVPDWCGIGTVVQIASNRVRKDLPNKVETGSTPRAIYNTEGLPISEAFYQYDLTAVAIETGAPGYTSKDVKGATLHCWMYNDMIFDLDSMEFKNQTGRVFVGPVPYWDPAAATWNNKPTRPPQTFTRTSEVHDVAGEPTNEGFTEHWIDISSQVLAAIAAPSPYLTITHTITPYYDGDFSAIDPTWRLGLSPAEYHPTIILR